MERLKLRTYLLQKLAKPQHVREFNGRQILFLSDFHVTNLYGNYEARQVALTGIVDRIELNDGYYKIMPTSLHFQLASATYFEKKSKGTIPKTKEEINTLRRGFVYQDPALFEPPTRIQRSPRFVTIPTNSCTN